MNNKLPWVEKYRPTYMSDIISHKEILNTLTNLINNNKLPHMIFYGPPGTGKTTTILSCAKQIYGDNFNSMILELNGSDDRGINIVREQIKNFSATDSKINNILEKSKTYNIKLVILDEVDAMTYDAQFALRRVVEIYTESTRFCMICNYLTKIIPALQSRCQMFRFMPIDNIYHLEKLENIVKLENINIDTEALNKIVTISEGDMRKSLNLLQSLHMSENKEKITINILNKIIGYISDSNINKIFEFKKKSIKEIYEMLQEILSSNNISYQDLIKELTIYYKSIKITKNNKITILNTFIELSKIEIYLTNNTNNILQLLAISSIIYNNFNNK